MRKFLPLIVLFFTANIATAQNVGIGTPSPGQKLDVDGWIQVGDQTKGTTATEGAIRYHSVSKVLQYFDGVNWVSLSAQQTINAGVALGNGANLTGSTTSANRYATALGDNARAQDEGTAIGVGNSGSSTTTTATGYGLAIGQNISATGGSNGLPSIALGAGFTNSTGGTIKLGMNTSVPSITILNGSGSTPGNVAIGSSTASERLHVTGGNFRIENGTARVRFFSDASSDRGYIGWTGAGIALWNNDNSPLTFGTTGAERMRISDVGNVGIGSTNPLFKLEVNGSVRLGTSSASGLTIQTYAGGLTDVPGSASGMQLLGPTNAHIVWDIQGNDGNDGFYVRVPTTPGIGAVVDKTAFSVKASGNVGIGISTPSEALHVVGNALTTGYVNASDLYLGSTATGFEPNATTSWTPIIVKGIRGGYSGFYFEDEGRHLMIDNRYTGVYDGASWVWLWDNGTLSTGTVPWGRLSGIPAQATTWQTLGTSGNSITLSNGGSITAPYASSAGSANTANALSGSGGGYLGNEQTGGSGVYIDWKDNVADDFDFRMIWYAGISLNMVHKVGTLDRGVKLDYNATSWSTVSDSTQKENVRYISSEDFLSKFDNMRLGTWNYIGDDATKWRHYGPMAQDFHYRFGQDELGVIGNDTSITSFELAAVSFTGVNALKERTDELMKRIAELEALYAALKQENNVLKTDNASYQERLQLIEELLGITNNDTTAAQK